MLFAETKDQVAQGRVTLDRLSRPLEALLGAFEPKGMAAAESLSERLEASCCRLEAVVKGAARDAMQHTLGLVKSHLPEADLDPVGDGVPEDCSVADWEARHGAVLEIAERIVAELSAAGLQKFLLFILLQEELVRMDRLNNNIYVNNVYFYLLLSYAHGPSSFLNLPSRWRADSEPLTALES